MGIIGLILFIVGAVQHGRKGKKAMVEQPDTSFARPSSFIGVSGSSSKVFERIYCRYCGKEKHDIGDFCSVCGRSSQTNSSTMKTCPLCYSPMSEDSRFCGNCGIEFQETRVETTSEPLHVFEETKLGVKIGHPVGWNREVKKARISFSPQAESESADIGILLSSEYTDKRNVVDFMTNRINSIRTSTQDFKLLESDTNVTLSERPAYRLVYLRSSEKQSNLVKRMEYGTVVDN